MPGDGPAATIGSEMTISANHPTPRLRLVLAGGLLALLSLAAAALLALPAAAAKPSHRLVAPAAFAKVVAEKGTVTIDVRGPGEPFIAGTDLSIAYDTLAASKAKLPAAKTTRLAIYCHSGRRSAIAAQTLLKLGYTDIVELKGGASAWAAAGRKLLPANATGTGTGTG